MNLGGEALFRAALTVRLILNRDGATLGDLREALWTLSTAVRPLSSVPSWPDGFHPSRDYEGLRQSIGARWPELGFYDEATYHPVITEATETVGDAVDDLADLVQDVKGALFLVERNVTAATSWLSFHARIHWEDHVQHLIRHLDVLLSDQP